jgi:hypothetical protein
MDASLDYLIGRAYKSPDVLLDARDSLGEQDAEARALLYRAARLTGYPADPYVSPGAPATARRPAPPVPGDRHGPPGTSSAGQRLGPRPADEGTHWNLRSGRR